MSPACWRGASTGLWWWRVISTTFPTPRRHSCWWDHPTQRSALPGRTHTDQDDGQRLGNLARILPKDQHFTRIYRGRGELIDHLLVSHTLGQVVQTVSTGESDISSITDQPHATPRSAWIGSPARDGDLQPPGGRAWNSGEFSPGLISHGVAGVRAVALMR